MRESYFDYGGYLTTNEHRRLQVALRDLREEVILPGIDRYLCPKCQDVMHSCERIWETNDFYGWMCMRCGMFLGIRRE